VVNSGGIKLIPEQIEEKLSNGIHSVFCRWDSDSVLGEKLIFVIEGDEQA
jgi:O-succinylbenzoic acid--CoA ligase